MSLVILRFSVVSGLFYNLERQNKIYIQNKRERFSLYSTGFWQSIKFLQQFQSFVWLGNRYVCHGNYNYYTFLTRLMDFFECMKNCKCTGAIFICCSQAKINWPEIVCFSLAS